MQGPRQKNCDGGGAARGWGRIEHPKGCSFPLCRSQLGPKTNTTEGTRCVSRRSKNDEGARVLNWPARRHSPATSNARRSTPTTQHRVRTSRAVQSAGTRRPRRRSNASEPKPPRLVGCRRSRGLHEIGRSFDPRGFRQGPGRCDEQWGHFGGEVVRRH
jgi:hypothetical protein